MEGNEIYCLQFGVTKNIDPNLHNKNFIWYYRLNKKAKAKSTALELSSKASYEDVIYVEKWKVSWQFCFCVPNYLHKECLVWFLEKHSLQSISEKHMFNKRCFYKKSVLFHLEVVTKEIKKKALQSYSISKYKHAMPSFEESLQWSLSSL